MLHHAYKSMLCLDLYTVHIFLSVFFFRDKKMADQIRDKIKSSETYLQRLKTSERTMGNHQMKRNNHKKLTVF